MFKRILQIAAPLTLIAALAGCPVPVPEPEPEPIPTPTENTAPEITSLIPSIGVNEGQAYSYTVTATDADGDALTWSLASAPSWLSVDASTGVVSGTAPTVDLDTAEPTATISVSDGTDAVTQDFNIIVKDSETRTIIKEGADRLLTLQNANGSWDWIVTNATGPTGTTYLNIAGVTGEGLIDAYNFTGQVKYRDAAKKTGDFIITELDKLPEAKHFNAFNMVFLKDLAEASGDITYSNYVTKKMNDLLTKVTYHTNGVISTDSIAGLTADELVVAEEIIRGTAIQGIKLWDLYHFVQLAKEEGNNAYATGVANGIENYLKQAGYNDTIGYYELGLAAGVMGLKNAGMDYSSYLEKLLARQNASNGSFGENPQPTAYALMALDAANSTDAKKLAALYLKDTFGYNNIDGWLNDASGSAPYEISEVTSEAAQALYDSLLVKEE
jgi:hypothetical protein